MPWLKTWKERARQLQRETYTLYLACRDPRTPWYAKALAACVVAYACSPLDLIPDPIPVLGYLDDLVLIPLGVLLVCRLVPAAILEECQQRAETLLGSGKPTSWIAAGVIVAVWLTVAMLVGRFLWRRLAL